jgi:hypothetical protein
MHRSSDHGFQSASGPAASPTASGSPAASSLAASGSSRGVAGRWVAALTLALAPLLGISSACLDRPIGRPEPVTTNIFVDRITQTSVDKIDLLFMIDNSISMSDKQEILRAAVPDLVSRLVNPICVDSTGGQFPPPPPGGLCPAGQTQEFNPIKDINIGVVSSSLGDVGANVACPTEGFARYVPDRIDLAHLIGSLPRGRGSANTTEGFLAWRAATTNLVEFNGDFQQMVQQVGENGCGWEASLESWYRFLVDPYPYQQLVRVQCPGSTSTGKNCVQQATDAQNRILLDETLLAQRNAFLRPDSLVAIIMLSDENDCSMQVGNQTWVVAAIDDSRPMFRGSSICDSDPNNKCCYSCPLGPPTGCTDDPICAANPTTGTLQNRLPANADGQNLRCFQQKRRFGVDFLYPTKRYVNALKNLDICWNDLELDTDNCADADKVQNPLYAGGRLPSLVFFGGIIGVPWQAIDSNIDANNRPLADGQLRFQNATELTLNGTWDQILGSPGIRWRAAGPNRPEVNGVPAIPPALPQMVESEFARPGVTLGNPINGREFSTLDDQNGTNNSTPDDLEYACIFPLATPRDCAQRNPDTDACDCYQGKLDRPLCEQQPGVSAAGTNQYWAKAYPGTRHLEVLKDYGPNSIVASICARNVTDPNASDFGYRPAIAAIIDRLKEQLGNRCLPRSLNTNPADGTVACNLVETIPRPEAGTACTCDPTIARQVPDPVLDSVVRSQLAADRAKPCGDADPNCVGACLCEVLQVQQVTTNPDNALTVCQNLETASGVEGWCYIDSDQNIGNDALVENCPATQKRLLRFVGRGLTPNTTTLVACTGSSFAARDDAPEAAAP